MTLNQLVQHLKNFADGHRQINSFGQGDLPELAASVDVKYPVMWVVINTTRYSSRTQQYPVRIIFADLIFEDKTKNELEVQSDMLQVAQDCAAHFTENPDFDFITEGDIPMNFFTDSFSDLVAGVDVTLTIRDIKPLDRCVIPN